MKKRYIRTDRHSVDEILRYEVHSHWLARWVWFSWGQKIMGRYLAFKVRRKYKRYLYSLEMRDRIINKIDPNIYNNQI